MTKIIVTGANGQLGKTLQDIAPLYPNVHFYFLGKDELSLNNFEKLRQVIQTIKPAVVINSAAYTAVDKAETERELAFLINGEAAGKLAVICKANSARLLHVSTDYVFDGDGNIPYKENDTVSPINQYGASKLKGEVLILAEDGNAAIIRTSWVYSKHGSNFVKTMLRLMNVRESVGVVNDQLGCPTYAIDLADALMEMALAEKQVKGIYHFSNSGPISWYEFAKAIKDFTGSKCVVKPILTVDFPTPAKRPHYSALSNEKIKIDFGIVQKPWQESLQKCLREMGGLKSE
jgi:dTDP-4-dehydrorhamnose reductase